MSTMRTVACALLALLLATPPSLAQSEADVAALTALLEGRYRTVHDAHRPDAPQLTDQRQRVEVPALGGHVFYWQLNSGPEQAIYRQRLLQFVAEPDTGYIRQRTWSFVSPERFADRFHDAGLFAAITAADLASDLPEGCDPRWRPAGDRWYGYVDPSRCVIFSERHQEQRHIEAEVELSQEGLRQAERGFAADGGQLFGTPPGELLSLERLGLSEEQ
jgi:hypothetical protein